MYRKFCPHVQSFFSCKHTLKTAPSCHSLSDQIYVTKWQTTFHIPRREHAFYFRVTGFPANVNLPFSHPRKVNFWHFERRSRSLRVETCPQGSVGLLTSVFLRYLNLYIGSYLGIWENVLFKLACLWRVIYRVHCKLKTFTWLWLQWKSHHKRVWVIRSG